MKTTRMFLLGAGLAMLTLVSCKSRPQASANTSSAPVAAQPVKAEKVPVWAPKESSYKPSRSLDWDILNTHLDIRFDWDKQWVMGMAVITAKPWFYPSDTLRLDARGFDIHGIYAGEGKSGNVLKYRYDSSVIHIGLGRSYSRAETLKLSIDYTAKPNELSREGSQAISDAKGLYFINPKGEIPNKPKQIWTQGETESNSCWFPTVDSPNERMTQEICITTDQKYVTLSNGKLTGQVTNPDGTRTDCWKQDLGHAPYLAMMGVGEFAVVRDNWRGKEVNYYVEKEYEPYAKLVFGNTPEMIETFSKKLGVDYPWDKYSQIVVRDFVSGAMENTSAVVHFSALQHDAREHLDSPMEDIIAHELFHHWFGDLVTCESWANLPLNESFATYGEILWNESKYGKDAGDEVLNEKMMTYLGEAARKREPMIRYHYEDKEDMFDSHSYAKGGCILQMLRNTVGDEAFFASLKLYLERNAYTSVEIHDLRLAFEDVTGQDLHWFFDQWFMSPGHPELTVDYQYSDGRLAVHVRQTQDQRYIPIHRFPLKVAAGSGKEYREWAFTVSTEDTTLYIPMTSAPEGMIFDADKTLLCALKETKEKAAWIWQLRNAKNFRQKDEAIQHCSKYLDEAEVRTLFAGLMQDSWKGTREKAFSEAERQEGEKYPELVNVARRLALSDESAGVRYAAMSLAYPSSLEEEVPVDFNPAELAAIKTMLEKACQDSSYTVQGQALTWYTKLEPVKGMTLVREAAKNPGRRLIMTLFNLLYDADAKEGASFLSTYQNKIDGFGKFGMISALSPRLRSASPEVQTQFLGILKDIAGGSDPWYMRMAAVNNLISVKDLAGVKEFLMAQKEKETNGQIKAILESVQ